MSIAKHYPTAHCKVRFKHFRLEGKTFDEQFLTIRRVLDVQPDLVGTPAFGRFAMAYLPELRDIAYGKRPKPGE